MAITPAQALDLITDIEISHSQENGEDIEIITRTFNFEKLAVFLANFTNK